MGREHLTVHVRPARQARVHRVSVRTARFPVEYRMAERAPRARRHTLTWVTAHTREHVRSLVPVHRVSRRVHWVGA